MGHTLRATSVRPCGDLKASYTLKSHCVEVEMTFPRGPSWVQVNWAGDLSVPGSFLKKIYVFIYLFLAALGLCCCSWAFSSCGKRRLLFFVVRGLLMAVASLVAEHGL